MNFIVSALLFSMETGLIAIPPLLLAILLSPLDLVDEARRWMGRRV